MAYDIRTLLELKNHYNRIEKSIMTTYIFPGQGSQIRGMGDDLFPLFPEHIQKANEILGYSIEKLCLDDQSDDLNRTEFTQPALYVVNSLAYLKKMRETDVTPKFVAGHSLGEYSALFAANVFNFETGLKLVKKRGELMSQASGGAMAAVIGLDGDAIQTVIIQNQLSTISVANYNSHTQIVVTGFKEDIKNAKPLFEAAGAKRYVPLNVSGAFHSPYMQTAQNTYTDYLQQFTFLTPNITVIANVNAKPYPENHVSALLAQQITHPVKWTQSIEYLLAQGETTFEEIGPGKVLTGLIRRIQQGQ